MKDIFQFSSDNISFAWGKLFLAIASLGGSNQPACISIHGFTGSFPEENENIRLALDKTLAQQDKTSIKVSSMVVFPYQDWLRLGCPAHDEFRLRCVEQFAPRLKALHRKNKQGIYFDRMMNYSGVNNDGEPISCDQIGKAIQFWNHTKKLSKPKRPRRSAMQIACIDPTKDMKQSPYSIFPCLQQVGISYDEHSEEFYLNAYYPVQYLVERAYGNLLGLCGLGAYLASQIETNFAGLNCFVGMEELDVTKQSISELLDVVNDEIQKNGVQKE